MSDFWSSAGLSSANPPRNEAPAAPAPRDPAAAAPITAAAPIPAAAAPAQARASGQGGPVRAVRRGKTPVVPALFTLLVGGVFFGLYRYVSRTPAPAEANPANAPKAAPAKAPVDPFLKELLSESTPVATEPAATRPATESRSESPAPKPAPTPARPPRAAAAFDPDFRSRGGSLDAELARLKGVTARQGSGTQLKAGDPVQYARFSQLPVTITSQIGFAGVRTWLEDVHQSCPAAAVGELKLKRRQGRDAQPPHGLTLEATVWLHGKASSSEGATGGDERNIVPRLDFVRVLRELSALASDDPVQFIDVTLTAERGWSLAPTQAPRILGSFSYFGHQDIVDLLVERIPRHPFIERHTVEAKGARRTVQFSTPRADRMPPPGEALRDPDSLDPFRIVKLKTGI
jgi:hypothetical protein